jgi:transposase InsO family protein
MLCRTLDVSRSGYYDWRNRGPSRRQREDARLSVKVRALFFEHRGRLGEPRLRPLLGEQVSKKRVARLMRENDLYARRKRKFVRTTAPDPSAAKAPNLLARNFSAPAPNTVWVGDITYIPTVAGWLYLAFLLDLCSRAVVGWRLSESLDASLAVGALEQAVARREPEPGLLVHSDQGCQYTSEAHVDFIKERGFVQSMSRKGNCWDNAVAESFISSLKIELDLIARSAPSKEAAKAMINDYIEHYYNRRRPHSSIGLMTPLDYEYTLSSGLEIAA